MCERLRLTIVTLVLVVVPILIDKPSHAQLTDSRSGSSSRNEVALRAWLKSADLADKFDIVRIGPGPHPDPKFALDGMISYLELRFITPSSNRVEGAARFQKLLSDYQTDHGIALPEKLLYVFANTFAIDPWNACLDLHLYDSVYSVYYSRSDGSLVVSEVHRSTYDVFPVTIPAVAPKEQFRAHLATQAGPDAKSVRDAVENFLKAYIEAKQGKGNAKLEITPDVHRQDQGYVRLFVTGVKGMVTPPPGFWEWLDIAVIFHPIAATGKDSQWNFICNVEVKYASSSHETRPTDADLDYPSQVAGFRSQLEKQLQANLEKGIHD